MYSKTLSTLYPDFAEVSKYGSPLTLLRSMSLFISLENKMASSIVISRLSCSNKSCLVPTTTFRQSSFADSKRGRNLALKIEIHLLVVALTLSKLKVTGDAN